MRASPVTVTTHSRRYVPGWLWPLAVIGAVACVPAAQRTGRPASAPWESIAIDAVAVPLNPENPSLTNVGEFTYAGGLALSSRQTNRLHELSDLAMHDEDRITAVGDAGILFEARLLFDDRRHLVGITDARVTPLAGENGAPLTGRAEVDAEGLTRLPDGELLVSFERDARIWRYPEHGGVPRPVPVPKAQFPSNEGMEALMATPDVAADAYVVGVESTGDTWTCRLSADCVQAATIEKPKEFGLVSFNRLPDGSTVYLLRAYDPVRRTRIVMRIVSGSKLVAEMNMAAPLTVDNFEGVTSAPGRNGGRRFYLLSDDNDSTTQRTLLMAFDWNPPAAQGNAR